jgi:hypothetical protein
LPLSRLPLNDKGSFLDEIKLDQQRYARTLKVDLSDIIFFFLVLLFMLRDFDFSWYGGWFAFISWTPIILIIISVVWMYIATRKNPKIKEPDKAGLFKALKIFFRSLTTLGFFIIFTFPHFVERHEFIKTIVIVIIVIDIAVMGLIENKRRNGKLMDRGIPVFSIRYLKLWLLVIALFIIIYFAFFIFMAGNLPIGAF